MTQFGVTATAEAALHKLKRAGVPVQNCKKQGAEFIFCVKNEYRKKVFAIFASTCYNVKVKRESVAGRALALAKLRAGLIAGFILFAAAAFASDGFVLKITVGGSGSYLKNSVLQIVYSSGFTIGAPYSRGDAPLASARIMALPDVTFCNLSKSGGVLYVDVQTNPEESRARTGGGLYSDARGTVNAITALCGTALVSQGDEVEVGTALIGAYSLINGEEVSCLAAGYAEIICSEEIVYGADCESGENLRLALAACLSYSESILTREYTVKSHKGGVNYIINFTYLHTISINLL